MMKILIGLYAAAALFTFILIVRPAQCAWCPDVPCYDAGACGACACFIPPMETKSYCVDILDDRSK